MNWIVLVAVRENDIDWCAAKCFSNIFRNRAGCYPVLQATRAESRRPQVVGLLDLSKRTLI